MDNKESLNDTKNIFGFTLVIMKERILWYEFKMSTLYVSSSEQRKNYSFLIADLDPEINGNNYFTKYYFHNTLAFNLAKAKIKCEKMNSCGIIDIICRVFRIYIHLK